MGASRGSNNGGGRRLKLINGLGAHISKDEKDNRQQAEDEMTGFPEIDPKPPAYLGSIAKKTWKKIVPQLKQLPIRELDQGLIEQYCGFYEIWVNANKDIKEYGIKTEDGAHRNPAFSVLNEAASSMRRCAGELGLTVDSRLRLLIPNKDSEKKESLFDMFGSGK